METMKTGDINMRKERKEKIGGRERPTPFIEAIESRDDEEEFSRYQLQFSCKLAFRGLTAVNNRTRLVAGSLQLLQLYGLHSITRYQGDRWCIHIYTKATSPFPTF